MSRLRTALGFALVITCYPSSSHAQILEIIQAAVTKVIVAIDLKVQRLQENTIELQEAQKKIENTLSQLKLKEIGDWVQKQKDLYDSYFKELQQVKTFITEYHAVKDLISEESAIVREYQQAMSLFRQDNHFSSAEIQHMEAVYQGILSTAGQLVDQVTTVLQALVTSMTDEQRLRKIDAAAAQTTKAHNDLQAFTRQNQILSLQRAQDQEDADQIKRMYDLP
ncbi:conjugal transfer protein TraI [Puia sp. P3]|uniref:conjugal transfer protein TraI n=1 Tax=Puia sp. P3 TaxID=3423952 RepID=UPI003D667A6F